MDYCKIAVDKAMKLGMDEADATVRKIKTTKINFAQEIQTINTQNRTIISVRVIKDKKIATYTTTLLDKEAIFEIVEKATKIAKVAPEDPNWDSLNQKIWKSTITNLLDPTLEKLELGEITGAINTGLDNVASDGRALITRGMLSVTKNQFSFANCYSDSMGYETSYYSTYILAKAVKGGESTGSDHTQTRFWKDINYTALTNSAIEMSQKYLEAKPIKSEKIPSAGICHSSAVGVFRFFSSPKRHPCRNIRPPVFHPFHVHPDRRGHRNPPRVQPSRASLSGSDLCGYLPG